MKISLFEKIVTLPKPVVSSVGLVESGINYYLQMTHDGIEAYGEAAPLPFSKEANVTLPYGNSYDVVRADLVTIMNSLEIGTIDLMTIENFHRDYGHVSSEARACVDMLLHDYVAKEKKIPVWKLYTDVKNKNQLVTKTTATDSMDEFSESIQTGKKYFSVLKIKATTGNYMNIPYELFDNIEVDIDFNGLFKNFESFQKWFSSTNLPQSKAMYFEEPFSFKSLTQQDLIDIPNTLKENQKIIFDDSLISMNAFDEICSAPVNFGLNLKIQKLGGIYPCIQMFQKNPQKLFMLGCMLETSLGICAGIQLGYAISSSPTKPLILDLDSDMHLGLDPMSPSVTRNERIPTSNIGLGYNPNISNLVLIHRVENSGIRDTYNKAAGIYEELINSPEADNQLIPKLKDIFERNTINKGTLLDVGCGPGNLKTELGDNFVFTGIDISEKMLEKAQTKGYKTHHGDMFEELRKFSDHSFDYVVALSSLHFVKDIDVILKEFDRIARKGWIVSLEDITDQYQKEFGQKNNIIMYNHSRLEISNAVEDIYFDAWTSPTTNERIHARMIFKKVKAQQLL